MHATEGAYNLCELTEVQLQIGLGLQDYRYTFIILQLQHVYVCPVHR